MPEINLLHVNAANLGYGRLGIMLAKELQSLGVDVYDDVRESSRPKWMKFAVAGRPQKVCNVKCWVCTPAHIQGYWDEQHRVIFTMWETMFLPEEFRADLDNFDQIIVPSHQNLELFSEWHPNVKYVPLGVDPDDWYFIKRTPPKDFFYFMVAGSGPRKGLDLAYQAFRKLWPKEPAGWPKPRLIIKSPRGAEYGGPDIDVVSGKLSAEEEIALYATAHCYVGPSRGEGFGLMPLQAIAQGCPTILTDAHGHQQYAHLGWGIGATPSKADYFVFGESGDWWEPSLDDLCDRMRWIYDNYGAACERAEQSASVVAKEWTWRRSAERLIEAIGPELLDQPYIGLREWREMEKRRYLVITTEDFVTNSAGMQFRFEAGKEYYEVPFIKRLLFEAGKLHPRCLEGNDTGLAEAQAKDLSASRAYCPTCQQRLNTQPRKADDLFEKYSRDAQE